MGKAHSIDLRERIKEHYIISKSCRKTAAYFKVSVSSVVKLMDAERKTGSLLPKRQGPPPNCGKLSNCISFLIECVSKKPDITMAELAAQLLEEKGVSAQPATLSRRLIKEGFRLKKKP